jgi:hypothetical protein
MDIVTEELRWTSNKDFAAYVAAECALSHMRVWQDQQQAADSPPNWFCNGYSANELLELKKKRLAYHAKKTEGVLSLLLCCYDMLFVVKHSGEPDFKKYGVHLYTLSFFTPDAPLEILHWVDWRDDNSSITSNILNL